MNIQKLTKEQKVSLLKALAAGKITKSDINNIEQADTCFVEFQNHNPIEYSIAGERVDEQQFRRRLEIAQAIFADEVIHIRVVHEDKKQVSYSK